MNTLQIAYKILYNLEHKKDAAYMGQLISPAALKVPEDKWLEVLGSLIDEGYVSGAKISEDILGDKYVDIKNIKITMKGAEYLNENSVMKKFSKLATNIIKIVK